MKKIINTVKSPAPIGPYNQAILKENMLYIRPNSTRSCFNET